jgi:hypothetical protein
VDSVALVKLTVGTSDIFSLSFKIQSAFGILAASNIALGKPITALVTEFVTESAHQ